jgi:hypothetical protein
MGWMWLYKHYLSWLVFAQGHVDWTGHGSLLTTGVLPTGFVTRPVEPETEIAYLKNGIRDVVYPFEFWDQRVSI